MTTNLPPCPKCGGESVVIGKEFGYSNGMNTLKILLACKNNCAQKEIELKILNFKIEEVP